MWALVNLLVSTEKSASLILDIDPSTLVATFVKLDIVESNLFDIAPKSDLDWLILFIAPSITVIACSEADAVPKPIDDIELKLAVAEAVVSKKFCSVVLLLLATVNALWELNLRCPTTTALGA